MNKETSEMEKNPTKTDQPVKWILTKDISVIWLESQRPWDSVAESAKKKIIAIERLK